VDYWLRWPIEKFGDLIWGVVYDMDSVPSNGWVQKSAFGAFVQAFADGYICAKRGDTAYRFAVDAEYAQLEDFNDNFALIETQPTEKGYGWNAELRLLQSDKSLHLASSIEPVRLSAQYAAIREYSGAHHAIVNANGEICGTVACNWWSIRALPCNVFLIIRGPYIGIIDASGNWLVKTIAPALADDIADWERTDIE